MSKLRCYGDVKWRRETFDIKQIPTRDEWADSERFDREDLFVVSKPQPAPPPPNALFDLYNQSSTFNYDNPEL